MSPRTRHLLAAALLAPALLAGGAAAASDPAVSSPPATQTPAATATATPGGSETPAVEGEITWGVEPSDKDGKPTGEVSYRLSLDPGATVSDYALVTNYSEVPVTFDILAADGVVSADGNFDILRADEQSVDIGTWIDIQDSVEIGAGESAVIPWTLTVPANATPGDHPGGIVASITQSASGEGPQVGFATRVGVRIHLRVTGEISPVVAFSDVTTRYDPSLNPFLPGDLHVEYTMSNDGNVRLGSIQQFELFGLFRLPAGGSGPSGTVIGQQREILPGQSARVSTVIEDVWPLGRLTTSVSAFNDAVGIDQLGGDLPAVRASDVTWAVPWAQLAVLALLVALWWLWRRARRRRAAAHAAAIERARAEGARESTAASDAQAPEDGAGSVERVPVREKLAADADTEVLASDTPALARGADDEARAGGSG